MLKHFLHAQFSSNLAIEFESNLNSRKIVLEVCDTIVKRAENLGGAGIVGILQKIEDDSKGAIFGKRTVVAMDGGLYERYPQYRRYLKESVRASWTRNIPLHCHRAFKGWLWDWGRSFGCYKLQV